MRPREEIRIDMETRKEARFNMGTQNEIRIEFGSQAEESDESSTEVRGWADRRRAKPPDRGREEHARHRQTNAVSDREADSRRAMVTQKGS